MELSGYKDFQKLAEGHDRVVYSALRVMDKKSVVLKMLRQEHPGLDTIALMYHEFDIAKELTFPGIIQTYELIDNQNKYALVQENIDGISLHKYIQQYPITDIADFLNLAIPMVIILGDLHKNQVIHKDIKPGNFIINPRTLEIKLTDFNYSSKLSHETQDIVPPSKLEGTLLYMAPEQTGRMNMNIDYRSDFYSLGVAFYEMLTGRLPFDFSDPLELLHAHLANSIPQLTNSNMSIPPVVVEIVHKLMAKNPADRYQSAIGVQEDLELCRKALNQTGTIESFSIGTFDVSDRLNLSQKLYGREDATKTLISAYDRISNGAVEALMVSGYSGIGKTMLINEVHKPMVQRKGYFIRGKFDQLQRDMPYTAITQAFNHLAQLILAEPEERFKSIKENILLTLGSVGQVILDVAPELELLIGPQPPLEKLPPQQAQNRMHIFIKRFLNTIATADHPLVLFIDDLQWMDRASFNLLEQIILDEALHHFMLIGTYRDNEVDETHLLTELLNSLKNNYRKVNAVHLAPLTVENFSSLFQDSFNRSATEVHALAELIHQRTDGNPFFCKQVINLLYGEKLLHFNYERHFWDWDIARISELKITDNVVELMLCKLMDLPEETQSLLRYASCMSNRFSVEMLMLISGQLAETIGKALWPALEQDLLLSLRLGYKRMDAMSPDNITTSLCKKIIYQFIHDRVQQAAYQCIPSENKQLIHLQIARILLEKEPEACKRERIFEVTDHFNQASDLLEGQERLMVAQLNYDAAMQAKNANAYQPMANYIQAALRLLGEDSWDKQYEFTFKLNSSYALSLYLLSQVEKAEELTQSLFGYARTNADKIVLLRLMILSYNNQGKLEECLKTGKQALALLGIHFSTSPTSRQLFFKSLAIRWKMRKLNIATLDAELKDITNEEMIIAFDVFMDMFIASRFKGINNFIYLILLSMDLIVRYGKPQSFGMWITLYAFVITLTAKDVDLAYKYVTLIEPHYDNFPNKYTSCTSFMIIGYHLNHLRFHHKESRSILNRSYRDALESGNINISKQSINTISFCTMAQARSIEHTIADIKVARKELEAVKVKYLVELAQAEVIRFENLAYGANNHYDQLKELEHVINNGDNFLFKLLNLRDSCFYHYFCEEYDIALYYHEHWYPFSDIIKYDPMSYEVQGLGALSLAKFIPQQSMLQRFKGMRQLNKVTSELAWAAKVNPLNYLHHYLFVKAAKEQLAGDFLAALKTLNLAIEHAKKGDFYLWIGLGNELALELCLQMGQERAAESYIYESHYYYERYGLKKKVDALEQRFSSIFEKQIIVNTDSEHQTHSGSNHYFSAKTMSGNLDLMSVIKASQAISSEIELNKLYSQMLHIVLENAGADKAIFLEVIDSTCIVSARMELVDSEERFNIINILSSDYENVPSSIIQFSLRSKKTVVLDNAAQDNLYHNDPYVIRVKPKSILCLPILHQDKVLGLIYLENNMTVKAFTPERIAVLSTLSSQIAISLQNSHSLDNMQQLYLKAERFVPKQFLKLLDKKNIKEIELGDSVKINLTAMFADIRNFTTISERLNPEHLSGLLNTYLGYMAPVIREHNGFVAHFLGDGILALFPSNSDDAVRAAIQMRAMLGPFNEDIKSMGLEPIDMGIGLNYGLAMLSILGEAERIDANVVSDAINTASRIEALNKQYQTHLLISETVLNQLKSKHLYTIRQVDQVTVKGKAQSISVYEVSTK